jgi:hypothetical protein
MPRVAAAFFAFGVLCVLGGMGWGMHMGATNDFAMAPVHAHLNLLGWVTMALYGTFYTLTSATLSERLAWINFVLSALGTLLMIPALGMYLHTGDHKYIPGMIGGEILTVLGMLVFAVSVVRELLRKRI